VRLKTLSVGRLRGDFAAAVAGYERRIARYFAFEAIIAREVKHRGSGDDERVRAEEGGRLLQRLPDGWELIALHRQGDLWTSAGLARHLQDAALRAAPGSCFAIGGAYGLSPEVLAHAEHHLSLSAFTLPHDLARLVLAEQLYRAGTIIRGEPYHKAVTR
jgi:23S rRNA (pseudouridine1915-N3)-methyltransferase